LDFGFDEHLAGMCQRFVLSSRAAHKARKKVKIGTYAARWSAWVVRKIH
jgi:hypothetical protein